MQAQASTAATLCLIPMQGGLIVPTVQEATQMRGMTAVDRDGDKIGKIDDVYLDQDTGRPEWLAIGGGLFSSGVSFVPLAQATREGDTVRVPFEKSHVKDAPHAEADGALSQEEEARLYQHYGMDYGESRSDSGLPEGGTRGRTERTTGRGTVGRDTSGPETDEAMTRSEEELRVGTTQRETGRVRLKKYVVTENVTKTVPVQREEVRVEREPITDANRDRAMSGADLTEEEHEVTLHAEEPVVEKRTVPKERVRMDKDTVTDQRTVSEQLRKEQIESDGVKRNR
jgi:uncharacterized protein (TIGR02271 family)